MARPRVASHMVRALGAALLAASLVAATSPRDVQHGGFFRHELVYSEPIADVGIAFESVSWWQWLKSAFTGEATDHDEQTHVIDAHEYNESLAIYLAHVTSVAYCQAPHIRNWSCAPCALVPPLKEIRVVEDKKDSFQGLVAYDQTRHSILVAFRGSMDIPNWIDNLTFVKKKAYAQFPDVRVHSGFYWVYESVEKQVVPAVRDLLKTHPNASVVVTGHSLGGAVAALCGFELALIQEIPVQAVYTFGEPRVGNANFSALLNQAIPQVYRITHYRDIVPHLPPSWIGFRHTAQEVFYDEDATRFQLCDPSNGEDPLCSDSCSPFGCTSVVDHLTYLNVTMSHLIC